MEFTEKHPSGLTCWVRKVEGIFTALGKLRVEKYILHCDFYKFVVFLSSSKQKQLRINQIRFLDFSLHILFLNIIQVESALLECSLEYFVGGSQFCRSTDLKHRVSNNLILWKLHNTTRPFKNRLKIARAQTGIDGTAK